MRDPGVLALLKGLNPSVTPVPMEVSTTDGELAASFAGKPRAAVQGVATPSPEEAVIIREGDPTPRKPEASRERIDTTFRMRDTKPSPVLPLALAALVACAVVAFWLTRSSSVEAVLPAPTLPVVAAQAPAPSPAPDPARAPNPDRDPSLSPAPAPAPAPSLDLAPDPAMPGRAAASPQAAPVPPPAARPAKGSPSRRKEDEPERTL